jgi:hypothetical protein
LKTFKRIDEVPPKLDPFISPIPTSLQKHTHSCDEGHATIETYDAARAAIAKATGEKA